MWSARHTQQGKARRKNFLHLPLIVRVWSSLLAKKKNSGKKCWWREKGKENLGNIVVVCTDLFAIFVFRLLVEYTEDRSDWFGGWKEWKGYVYAGSMFVAAAIQSLALHQYFQIMNTIGMRVRTAIIGLVYEKVQEKIVGLQAYY